MEVLERDIEKFSESFLAVESEIHKSIIGQRDIIRNLLISVICSGHVLLEGLPGLGKTRLVKTVGTVLDLSFSRIQFTPDLMPGDVTGTDVFVKNQEGSGFVFQKGPIFANLLLADEINRATPKTQSALLEAMQERTVTAQGNTHSLPKPFFVLATQNPLETEGTYPLPEAQLDRFFMKLDVLPPAKEELLQIMNLSVSEEIPNTVLSGDELLKMDDLARQTPVSKAVSEYISDIVMKTHPGGSTPTVNKYVRYGSSPRGAISLLLASKALALITGRYNVAFEDVRVLAKNVLRHRVFLNFEAMADGITPDSIIDSILENMK